MYKMEKQIKDENKLINKFNNDKTPQYIQDFFVILGSGKSKLNYYIVIKDFLQSIYNDISLVTEDKIKHITYISVIKYLDSLISLGHKASTVKVKKDELSSFFKHLTAMKIIEKNVIDDIPKKKYKFRFMKNINKLPSDDSLEHLKNNINSISNEYSRKKNAIILETLLGTGLRVSECCGLNIGDLHLDTEYPYVEVLRKGCYSAEERAITNVSVDLSNKLKTWLIYRNNTFIGKSYNHEALFVNRNGNRTNEDNVKKMFEKYSGEITPHMIRSYYITNLLMKTSDEAFVQEQVGHVIGSSITKDVYAIGTKKSREILKEMK